MLCEWRLGQDVQDKKDFLDRMNKINRIGIGCSEILGFMPFAFCCAPCGFHSAFSGLPSPIIRHDRLRRAFDRMGKDLFEILFILSMPKIAELLLVELWSLLIKNYGSDFAV